MNEQTAALPTRSMGAAGRVLAAFGLSTMLGSVSVGGDAVDFIADVQPILARACYG
jgi:hypothetical protein